MPELRFAHEWLSTGTDEAAFRETSAQLAIYLGDTCLTRNEDTWSRTVRDSVLVSTYPLALWLASSWWRLNWEPLTVGAPSLDWRMSHELGAANHGYVWPRIVLASDGEFMNIWAETATARKQSINYLCGLDKPQNLKIADFQRSIDLFIVAVLNRLTSVNCLHTDLAKLWRSVCEDRADHGASRLRQLEAQLGFDPEECPADVMTQALELQHRVGVSAMKELAPVYGRRRQGSALEQIIELGQAAGMRGKPQVSTSIFTDMPSRSVPWLQGVENARRLRAHLGNMTEPMDNATLFGLVGLSTGQVERWSVSSRAPAAVAMPAGQGHFNFVPRRRRPDARRFEYSRFLGDHLKECDGDNRWLTETDVASARQKYQRSFAAEFLCPIASLAGFLDNDFTESAIEEAASHFGVSEKTVDSLLTNNGDLPAQSHESRMPYRLSAR